MITLDTFNAKKEQFLLRHNIIKDLDYKFFQIIEDEKTLSWALHNTYTYHDAYDYNTIRYGVPYQLDKMIDKGEIKYKDIDDTIVATIIVRLMTQLIKKN